MTQGAKQEVEMTDRKFKPVEEQLAYIKKGAAEIIPEPELAAKLEASRKSGKPLRVYLGVDPTAPDLHLGHTVVLRKLKHFQDLGHTAVFLIGDFSAMIGDPTGVSETRPPLTREQVDAYAKTYLDQVYKILDREKTEVRYNSEWLSKMSAEEIVRLCAKYPLARMLEREDFRERLAAGWKGQLLQPSQETLGSRLRRLLSWPRRIFRPSQEALRARQDDGPAFKPPSRGKATPVNRPSSISIHELLYPLLTAIDAVELKTDVELGATEQKFNLLVHRDIQREYGLPGQVALTMPILVGLEGQRKMSKSLGNYVGITEPPNDMFGKIMSIPDSLMDDYFTLLTDRSVAFDRMLTDSPPMERKMELARLIVRDFHGQDAARRAADNFQRVFRDRQAPEEMTEITLTRVPGGLMFSRRTSENVLKQVTIPLSGAQIKWSKLLADLGQVSSTSEAERVIKQGGFQIDGQQVVDPTSKVNVEVSRSYEIRFGKKKFLRIVLQ